MPRKIRCLPFVQTYVTKGTHVWICLCAIIARASAFVFLDLAATDASEDLLSFCSNVCTALTMFSNVLFVNVVFLLRVICVHVCVWTLSDLHMNKKHPPFKGVKTPSHYSMKKQRSDDTLPVWCFVCGMCTCLCISVHRIFDTFSFGRMRHHSNVCFFVCSCHIWKGWASLTLV